MTSLLNKISVGIKNRGGSEIEILQAVAQELELNDKRNSTSLLAFFMNKSFGELSQRYGREVARKYADKLWEKYQVTTLSNYLVEAKIEYGKFGKSDAVSRLPPAMKKLYEYHLELSKRDHQREKRQERVVHPPSDRRAELERLKLGKVREGKLHDAETARASMFFQLRQLQDEDRPDGPNKNR